MRKRSISVKRRSKVRRERDPIPWKYCLLTMACGLILVAGFFMAASFHFSSINLGFKNSELRREVKELKTENRRLILRRELALSGISKTAMKIGFRKRTVNNIELVSNGKRAPKINSATPFEKEKANKAFTNSGALVKEKRPKPRGFKNMLATMTPKSELRERTKDGSMADGKPRKEGSREREASSVATKR